MESQIKMKGSHFDPSYTLIVSFKYFIFSPSFVITLTKTKTYTNTIWRITRSSFIVHHHRYYCSINMSCSVAVPTSPVFSFYNNNNVNSNSIPSTTPSCSSPPSSPLLKRRRPAKLDIPVASLAFGLSPAAAPSPARDAVVEVDGRGFSVFCKRGRRHHMEGRWQ